MILFSRSFSIYTLTRPIYGANSDSILSLMLPVPPSALSWSDPFTSLLLFHGIKNNTTCEFQKEKKVKKEKKWKGFNISWYHWMGAILFKKKYLKHNKKPFVFITKCLVLQSFSQFSIVSFLKKLKKKIITIKVNVNFTCWKSLYLVFI